MKNLKKLAQFVIMTITSAITVLFLMLILFRTDLIIDLVSSKPVLFMVGLIVGSTIGFLVGVLKTYSKLITELNNKKSEVKKLQQELSKTEKFLEKLQPDIMNVMELRAARCNEESRKRAQEILCEIANMPDDEEDDMSSDET